MTLTNIFLDVAGNGRAKKGTLWTLKPREGWLWTALLPFSMQAGGVVGKSPDCVWHSLGYRPTEYKQSAARTPWLRRQKWPVSSHHIA